MKQKLLNKLWLRVGMIVAIMTTALSGTAWADTASFAPSDFSGQGTSGTGSAISATVDGVTFACNKGYGTTQIRCYSGGKITISSSNTITAISFTFSGSYTGGLETSYTSLSTTSWEKTLSSQARITEITVTYTSDTPAYTITAQSNDNSYGTVSLSGSVITASPASGYTYADPAYTVSPANSATVAQEGNEFTVTPSANTTVTINFKAIPKHTVTFSVNGVTTSTELIEGADIDFPDDPESIDDKVFRGWVATSIVGTTNDEPTFVTSATMGENDVTYYAVFADVTPGTSELVNDVLTRATTGITGTSYSNWNNKTLNSSAVYAGNSAGGNSSIQLRASTPSGIVSTVSGGKVKKVTVDWNSNTSSGRELGVYVSSKAFGSSSSLYSLSSDDKMLGRITCGTSTEFVITGDYAYVGLRSEGNTSYLDNVTITWEAGTPDTYSDYCTTVVVSSVEKPVITVAENFYFSTTATITCTEGAKIYYSYDNESWTEYTGALTINETTTIYAKAVKDEDESRVASATATKTLAPTTVTVSGDLTLDLNGETSVDAGTLTASVIYNEAAVDGATVAWSSSDEAIATIDETGAVTLLTTGEVTFTATYAGNDDYAEAIGTKTITIIDSTVPGTEGNPYTVADVIAGKASGKTDVYVIGYIVGEFNSKTQAPRTSDFTTDANIALADEFTTSPTAALSIPVALPSDALKTAWGCKTNDGSTIGTKVIVCGKGESYFSVNGIKSTSSVTAVQSVTVSSAGYATYCSDKALDFTGTGITAYVGTAVGDKLTFTPITQVPANTGLLLVCADGTTADVPVIASAPAVADNCLTGVTEATILTADDYILNVVGGKAGFFKAGNDHKNLKANRAYIPASVGAGVKSFALDLEDNADGIEETLSDSLLKSENIYNLAGQRLSKMQKGINIVNGKKVLK